MSDRDVLDSKQSWFASRATTITIIVAAALIAALVQELVYPAYSWNRDEPVYLWQVELLRHGQLTSGDAGFPGLLQPWLTGWADGRFFTQYPLGWPVVILVGTLVGCPWLALSVAAASAVSGVWALATALGYGRTVANGSAVILLVSPIFAVQSGLYLTYLFTFGLGLWFLTAFITAVRDRSALKAVAAGVLFGWIFCTRTYDAALWGALAVGWAAITERGAWRAQVRTAAWFLVAVAPFLVLQALHNRHLTGSAFTFPITAKDPMDSLGFGDRRLMPTSDQEAYGPRRAGVSLLKHGFFVPWFLLGTYLGVVVAGAAAWFDRRRRSTGLVLALLVIFPLGYIPFWGTYISSMTVRLSGPIYFVPLYASLSILMASALTRAHRRHPRATLAMILVLALITVPVTLGRLGLNRELSRGQLAWRDSLESIEEPAIVLVAGTNYLLYLNPFSANAPEVEDGEVIYATNQSPTVLDLLDRYPERNKYLQVATLTSEEMLPSEDPVRPEVVLEPIERLEAREVEIEMTITPPRDGDEVWVSLQVAGEDHWRRLSNSSTSGERLMALWRITTADQQGDLGSGVVSVPPGERTVSVGVAFGSAERRSARAPDVRYRLHLRSARELDVMLPGVTSVGRPWLDDEYPERWDELLTVPALQVEVSGR